jgi:acyl dehydratase
MATSAEPANVVLAELERHIGELLGPTEPVLLTQSRIDRFAEVTQDHQWIHTDPQRAGSGPFGGTVAHGFLTLSLLSWMLGGLLIVRDVGEAINYGLDRVRFPAPAMAGASITGTARILGVERRPGRVLMRTRVTMATEAVTKPCCVADALTLYLSEDEA